MLPIAGCRALRHSFQAVTIGHRPRVVAYRRSVRGLSGTERANNAAGMRGLFRNDPYRAARIPSGQRAWYHRLVACRPCPLSIAGDDPHARLHLLEPATPGPRPQGRAGARPSGRPLAGAGRARLTGRRFGGVGTPPSSRYTAWQAAAFVSPLRWCRRRPLINGSGCAAASIGGTGGDASRGTRAAGPAGPWAGTLVASSLTPMPAGVPGRLGAGCPRAAPRRPPVSPRNGAVAARTPSGVAAASLSHGPSAVRPTMRRAMPPGFRPPAAPGAARPGAR